MYLLCIKHHYDAYVLCTGYIILWFWVIFGLLMGVIFLLGPYMLGTGLLCYLLSKEIYIINHETLSAASIGAVVIYAIKKFGPSVAAFADKLNEVGLFTISSLKWLKIYSFDILILGLRHKHFFCIVH